MGSLLNKEGAALLKAQGAPFKNLMRLQGLLSAADAFLLVAFYALIASAVSPVVIQGEPLKPALLYLALGLGLSRLVLFYVSASLNAALSSRLEHSLRTTLLKSVVRRGVLSPTYSSALSCLIVDAVENIVPYFTAYLKGRRHAIALPLVMLCAVGWVSPLSALILLAIAPLIPLFMIFLGKLTHKVSVRQLDTLTRLSERFYASFLNLTLIRLYSMEKAEAQRILRSGRRWRVQTLQILYVAFLSAAALEFFSTVGVALTAIILGFAIYEEGFSYTIALYVLFCVPEFFAPLRSLGAYYHQKQRALASVDKVAGLLKTAREAGENEPGDVEKSLSAVDKDSQNVGKTVNCSQSCGKDPTVLPPTHGFSTRELLFSQQFPTDLTSTHHFSHRQGLKMPLQVEGITVHYPDGRVGLRSFSAVFEPGKITALVGPSGAGKSTLLFALFKELSLSAGEIYLGDRPYSALSVEELRNLAVFVPQAPHLFYGTLRENLTLGRPDLSAAELESALKALGADFLIRLFPDGLETRVGEEQRLVSGGQLRLIALVRALLTDKPLILLDEPSASLDEESERLFLTRLRARAAGKTVILATHRRLSRSLCDREVRCA